MADDVRQPVAIRIARPYTTEDAFLDNELDTLTRTSFVLIGAQSRPQGVVLRFEVTLASGAPLLRGEGRVVGFKADAWHGQPGLTLRFTRLDPRSKALVDRAAAMRDARANAKASLRSASIPPAATPHAGVPAGPAPTMPDADPLESTNVGPPPSDVQRAARPVQPTAPDVGSPSAGTRADDETQSAPTARDRATFDHVHREGFSPKGEEAPTATYGTTAEWDGGTAEVAASSPKPVSPEPEPPAAAPIPSTTSPHPATEARSYSAPAAVTAPADRTTLLERLRDRARSLPASRVGEILSTGMSVRRR